MNTFSQIDVVSPKTCFVYFERQYRGFCAQHTINAALQRASVMPAELFEIGRACDAAEEHLLKEVPAAAAATRPGKRFSALASSALRLVIGVPPSSTTALSPSDIAAEVQNFDAVDGNFSVQVIIEALRRRKLECRMLVRRAKRGCHTAQKFHILLFHSAQNSVEYARTDLARDCRCFIVNHETHWFALRSIAGVWYDLNSLNWRPEPVSDASLRAYLDDLRRRDCAIYVVDGELPPVVVDMPQHSLPTTEDGEFYYYYRLFLFFFMLFVFPR